MRDQRILSAAALLAAAILALAALPPAATAAIAGGNVSIESAPADSGGGARLVGGSVELQGILGQWMLPAGGTDSLAGGVMNLRSGFFNPPRFSLQAALAYTLASADGGLTMSLPAGVVGRPTFDVALRRDPAGAPLAVDPAKIARANAKMRANNGPLAQARPNDVWELQFLDETGFFGGALATAGEIRLSYLDANGDGIVDGTSPPLRVKTMNLWMLDENLDMWVKVPDSSIDPAARTVAAPLSHLSVYALIGGADTAVADVYAFPVPFRPHGPNAGTGAGQTGTEAVGITFTNLPSEGAIEIYTVDGRRVKRLDIPANLAPARMTWDAKAASGIYVWRVVSGGNSKTGRLMVIR
jgi:hypothetical protein